jgi:hypothetical protein
MNYYKEYVAPKSYTIGTFKPRDYTNLEIKEQLTSDDVLFSHDFDDITFKVDTSTNIATYEFLSSPIDFNGENNDYIVYINNYILSNVDLTSGAISGTHTIKYYDVDKSVLATSTLNLAFASYSKNLLFKITLPADDIGLLMRYLEVNDFIVTLALNPFDKSTDDFIIYTVEFDGNGATSGSMSNQIFAYGESKALSSNEFIRTGYKFAGWSTNPEDDLEYSDKEVVQDLASSDGAIVKLYAMWSPITYTIVYLADNADVSGSTATSIHSYDQPSVLSTNGFTRTGYTFTGWKIKDGDREFDPEEIVTNLTSEDGDIIYVEPTWGIVVFKISFDANGGETVSPYAYCDYGCTYTIQPYKITREGYTLSGYTLSSPDVTITFDDLTKIAVLSLNRPGDVTVTAQWTLNT